MTTAQLLLETSKKMNDALARKNYKVAYFLLQLANELRAELGQSPLTLPNLEARFKIVDAENCFKEGIMEGTGNWTKADEAEIMKKIYR